jgi:hypothetical protein
VAFPLVGQQRLLLQFPLTHCRLLVHASLGSFALQTPLLQYPVLHPVTGLLGIAVQVPVAQELQSPHAV